MCFVNISVDYFICLKIQWVVNFGILDLIKNSMFITESFYKIQAKIPRSYFLKCFIHDFTDKVPA